MKDRKFVIMDDWINLGIFGMLDDRYERLREVCMTPENEVRTLKVKNDIFEIKNSLNEEKE